MATDCVNARTVLWYVTFFGFAVNYMIRINMNIAIVAMVKPRIKSSQTQGECYSISNITNTNTTASTLTSIIQDGFDWDEREQGMVLGAYFWLHWITQLPGGMLAQRYGGKSVYGLSQLAACICCLLIPLAAYADFTVLLLLRFAQGTVAGFTWPAMHTMTGLWIPPNERSKFVTAYLGSSVGAAMTYPVCGLLIDWFGWESVFYVSGSLGILWYIAWLFLVYDTPASHPRISEKEKLFIQKSLGQSGFKEKFETPWKAILTSLPLWMNIIAQWGGIWGLMTLLTQTPTYFKVIHGWDVRATGFLSGLPHFCRMGFAFIFSSLGDYLLRSNKMSRTNVRKLATGVCNIVQGLLTIALAYAGCNSMAAIFLITAATGVHGAVSTGPLASVVDISPKFAGISLGLCGMISAMPAFISPAIVGALTLNNQTIEQWKIVYLISAGMLLWCGILYLFFAESEIQPWDKTFEESDKNDKELKLLNVKKEDKSEKIKQDSDPA